MCCQCTKTYGKLRVYCEKAEVHKYFDVDKDSDSFYIVTVLKNNEIKKTNNFNLICRKDNSSIVRRIVVHISLIQSMNGI